MPIADAHIHLFRHGFSGRYGRSPAGTGEEIGVYETLRAEHDITAALVVGYEAEGIDASNNEYIRGLAQSRSWMSTVAHARPSEVSGPAAIETLIAAGHCGLSLYLDVAQASCALAWSREVWELLERDHALLSLNVTRDVLPIVYSLADAHAGCAFIVSHLGDPGNYRRPPEASLVAERIAPLLALASLPNAYVKISGLYAVSDPAHDYPHAQADAFVEAALQAFGPDRCMWGSDFSPSLDHVSFEQIANPPQLEMLAPDERTLVMGQSLLSVLQLRLRSRAAL